MCSSRMALMRSPFGTSVRRPMSRPSPRTSAITAGWRSFSSASFWRRRALVACTFSRKPSASTTSSTALATLMASGLPP